jgi:hypothetical protein
MRDALADWSYPECIFWLFEAFLGSIQSLSIAIVLGIMSIAVALLLPPRAFTDWANFPWSFGIGNIIFILAIYSAMSFLGEIMIQVALYQYDRERRHNRIRRSLGEMTAIAVLHRQTTDCDTFKELAEMKKWQETIFKWGACRSDVLARERLLKISVWAADLNPEMITRQIWIRYTEVLKQNPSVNWSDFVDSFLCNVGYFSSKKVYPALVDTDVKDQGDFENRIKSALKSTKDLCKEIIEQEKLFDQLRVCLSILWFVLILAVIFPLFGFSPNAWLLPLGVSITPTVVALTIVFGQTISSLIMAIIWTFYLHPFDVGDEVRVGKVPFTVKRIGLTHCIMENSTGMRVYYPTSLLQEDNVVNLSRVTSTCQHIEFVIPTLPPDHSASLLCQRLIKTISEAYPAAKLRTPTLNVIEGEKGRLCILVDQPNDRSSSESTERKQKTLKMIIVTLQDCLFQSSLPVIQKC